MSLELEFTARAQRDIRAIVQYIAKQNRDMLIAERFGQRLVDCCHDLAKTPQMGSPYRPRNQVKKINESAYKILYQTTSESVIILRIWDGRRGRNPRL